MASAACRKAHIPGDVPEDHEDNTFGLPEGAPVRKKLRAFFTKQLKQVVGFVAKIGAEIPDKFPRLADYDDPMASAMTPIIGQYWDKAGKGLRGRLGLDPDEWRVTDPNIHRAIAQQTIKFCQKTNATTALGVDAAVEAVRRELAAGLMGDGETIPQLTKRIQGVFRTATKSRAEMIARTETARAVHAASEMSAIESGVVSAKRIMLSAHSCPICVAMAEKAGAVPLGGSFGTLGKDPDYSTVRFPPIHQNCRCSLSFDLIHAGAAPVPAFVASVKKPAGKPEGMTGSGGLAEGLTFVPNPLRKAGRPTLVLADVAKLDRALARDADLYVGPRGTGASAIQGRYPEALRFLEKARQEGIPVHASEVSLNRAGQPSIDDGRHRFAALRDSGATAVPVAVPRSQVKRFNRLFGPLPVSDLAYARDPNSVGAHLEIANDEARPYFEAALEAIHAVHGDGGLPVIPAVANKQLKRRVGGYFAEQSKAVRIDLDPRRPDAVFTAVHEAGHFIDHQGLRSGPYDHGFASEEGFERAKKVMAAIEKSTPAKLLRAELGRAKGFKNSEYREDLEYWSEGAEKFSRAYSQYIAVRSGNAKMLETLKWARFPRGAKNKIPKMLQWADDEFEPIAALFDEMFLGIGWIKKP